MKMHYHNNNNKNFALVISTHVKSDYVINNRLIIGSDLNRGCSSAKQISNLHKHS